MSNVYCLLSNGANDASQTPAPKWEGVGAGGGGIFEPSGESLGLYPIMSSAVGYYDK